MASLFFRQTRGQCGGVEDGLARAVRAARVHWVRSVAQQRDAAEGPRGQRVLVDHRIFEHHVGGAEERWHVEPIELPRLDIGDEVLDARGAIPVPRLVVGRLDFPQPVDELAALLVDAVAYRVVHQLARLEPACPHHAGAREHRLPARDPAPHVDAGITRRAFGRIELLANDRMYSVATYGRRAPDGLAVLDLQHDVVFFLGNRNTMRIQVQAVRADALLERLEQDHLQVAAMDRKLRPFVAGAPPKRLAVDQLAEAVEEGGFRR